MRRTLTVLTILALIVGGCGTGQVSDSTETTEATTASTTTPSTKPAPHGPIEVVDRMLQAWASNDAAAYQAQYGPRPPDFRAARWHRDPVAATRGWGDFNGDGDVDWLDADLYWMAFDSLIGTETTWDCLEPAPDVVECEFSTVSAFTEIAGVSPVTWGRKYWLDGERIVRERTYRSTELDQMFEAYRTYEVFVGLSHRDQWAELFGGGAFGWVTFVHTQEAISGHEDLLPQFVEALSAAPSESVDVVERRFEAWADNDPASYAALYAENALVGHGGLPGDDTGNLFHGELLFGDRGGQQDDFDGDRKGTYWDDVQFFMALAEVFGEEITHECHGFSPTGVYCTLITTDVVIRRTWPKPHSAAVTFLVEGGLITEERYVRDLDVFGDPMSGHYAYKRWVRSNHPELWTQLFGPSDHWIQLRETIPIHRRHVTEFIDTLDSN